MFSAARRWVATVALGHFAVDFTAQLPTMMYPFLAQRLELSLGIVGVASAVWAITSATSQPIFGYLGDRFGRRWLAAGTIATMAVLVAFVPLVPSYGALLLLLGAAGIVVGGYHPQGAAIANEASRQHKGASVATFFLGGHLGFTVAPLAAGAVLAASGLVWMPLLALPALVVAALIPLGLRGFSSTRSRVRYGGIGSLGSVGPAIAAVLVVALVRGWAYASLNIYIPFFVSPDRPDPGLAGSMLAVYLGFHAAGAFSGGVLADRLGVRRMIGYSSLLLIPAVTAFALLPVGASTYVTVAFVGALIGAGFTPTVLLMQRMVPAHVGVGTGVILGVSFGAAAIGNPVTGFVGDVAGLNIAFMLLAVAQIAVLAALRWIPGRAGQGQVAPRPAESAAGGAG